MKTHNWFLFCRWELPGIWIFSGEYVLLLEKRNGLHSCCESLCLALLFTDRELFENAVETGRIWKRRLFVFMWTKKPFKNGDFRKQWHHDSHAISLTVFVAFSNFSGVEWGPVHTYPDTFGSVYFSFRIRLSSTHIRWIRPANPETFESALQSGNFWIRYFFGYVWTVKSGYFRIQWRCKIGFSHYSRLDRVATKQHGSQPKCFCCSCWAESSWKDS